MLQIKARLPDQTEREAADIVRRILDDVQGLRVAEPEFDLVDGTQIDVAYKVSFPGGALRLAVEAKSRITPQTAWEVCERFRSLAEEWTPVLYAPVVSERVAEILRKAGAGYVDRAGNCRIQARGLPFLIERTGLTTGVRTKQTHADPFSTKYSRVVRAMLSDPLRGWKVRELQNRQFAELSLGAVSKVRKALIEEGFAVERNRALYLRDASGLLEAWSRKYQGPDLRIPVYYRGGVHEAEDTVLRLAQSSELRCAVAGFSAAWKLAPEVRYSVGALYMETPLFYPWNMDQLLEKSGGKRVDSGPNVQIWTPCDSSVFAGIRATGPDESPATSPLQTYLDLKQIRGRGDEAASAIYDKYLKAGFDEVAKRTEEWRHDTR